MKSVYDYGSNVSRAAPERTVAKCHLSATELFNLVHGASKLIHVASAHWANASLAGSDRRGLVAPEQFHADLSDAPRSAPSRLRGSAVPGDGAQASLRHRSSCVPSHYAPSPAGPLVGLHRRASICSTGIMVGQNASYGRRPVALPAGPMFRPDRTERPARTAAR